MNAKSKLPGPWSRSSAVSVSSAGARRASICGCAGGRWVGGRACVLEMMCVSECMSDRVWVCTRTTQPPYLPALPLGRLPRLVVDAGRAPVALGHLHGALVTVTRDQAAVRRQRLGGCVWGGGACGRPGGHRGRGKRCLGRARGPQRARIERLLPQKRTAPAPLRNLVRCASLCRPPLAQRRCRLSTRQRGRERAAPREHAGLAPHPPTTPSPMSPAPRPPAPPRVSCSQYRRRPPRSASRPSARPEGP